jgi:alkylmercury lyase
MMVGPMPQDRQVRRRIATLTDLLVDRWVVVDRAALRPLFPLLATEGPVRREMVSAATGRKGRQLEDLLEAARAGRDERGRLVELFGVSVETSRHRIVVDGRELFACCALVSLMVPMMVDRLVRIESSDPISGRTIRLEVDPRRVRWVEPRPAVAGLVVADRVAMANDVRAALCGHILYFESPRSRRRFLSVDRRRFAVGIDDLQKIAASLYARIWRS